jgi:hypothetical protein
MTLTSYPAMMPGGNVKSIIVSLSTIGAMGEMMQRS